MLTKQAFFKQKDFSGAKAMGIGHFGEAKGAEKPAAQKAGKEVSAALRGLADFIIFRRTAVIKNPVFGEPCCSYLNIWFFLK